MGGPNFHEFSFDLSMHFSRDLKPSRKYIYLSDKNQADLKEWIIEVDKRHEAWTKAVCNAYIKRCGKIYGILNMLSAHDAETFHEILLKPLHKNQSSMVEPLNWHEGSPLVTP